MAVLIRLRGGLHLVLQYYLRLVNLLLLLGWHFLEIGRIILKKLLLHVVRFESIVRRLLQILVFVVGSRPSGTGILHILVIDCVWVRRLSRVGCLLQSFVRGAGIRTNRTLPLLNLCCLIFWLLLRCWLLGGRGVRGVSRLVQKLAFEFEEGSGVSAV